MPQMVCNRKCCPITRILIKGSPLDSQHKCTTIWFETKASLSHLIIATGLVILLKLDWNRRFCSPCDLGIWWVTLENNMTPLLYYIKICALFQFHGWIQTGVIVRKPSIRVQIGIAMSRVTVKFDRWSEKIIGHLLYYVKLCASF